MFDLGVQNRRGFQPRPRSIAAIHCLAFGLGLHQPLCLQCTCRHHQSSSQDGGDVDVDGGDVDDDGDGDGHDEDEDDVGADGDDDGDGGDDGEEEKEEGGGGGGAWCSMALPWFGAEIFENMINYCDVCLVW